MLKTKEYIIVSYTWIGIINQHARKFTADRTSLNIVY